MTRYGVRLHLVEPGKTPERTTVPIGAVIAAKPLSAAMRAFDFAHKPLSVRYISVQVPAGGDLSYFVTYWITPYGWARQSIPEATEVLNCFDRAAAESARDYAIARVARAHGSWVIDALAVIRSVASKKAVLTTDEVWADLGRDPKVEGRAMGAAMRMAAQLGIIRRTPHTRKSLRVACHRRDLRVWKSLLHA